MLRPAGVVSAKKPDLDRLRQTVVAEADTLDELLAGLGNEDLVRPTGCGDWTVEDIAAHLALGGRRYAERIRRVQRGEPPLSTPLDGRAIASTDIAHSAQAAASRWRPDVCHKLREINAQLVAATATLQPEDWERSAGPSGSVWQLLQMRLFELAVHHHDIRVALGRPAPLPLAAMPFLLAHLDHCFGRTLRPDPAARPVRLRFELTWQSLSPVDLWVGPESCTFGPASAEPADQRVRCSPEMLVLVATGRRNVSKVEATMTRLEDWVPLLERRFAPL